MSIFDIFFISIYVFISDFRQEAKVCETEESKSEMKKKAQKTVAQRKIL